MKKLLLNTSEQFDILDRSKKHLKGAFGRIDLTILIALVLVLAMLAFIYIKDHHVSTAMQCAANLRELGLAASLYEKDNQELLPYAFIVYDGSHIKTWDELILPFAFSGADRRNAAYLLRCPADNISVNIQSGVRRRTYAMPTHSMGGDSSVWPPGPNNNTGIGLWWQKDGWGMSDLTNMLIPCGTNFVKAAYHLSMIHATDTTLFLTENAQSNNIAFSYMGATIDGPSEHNWGGEIKPERYHGGRYNYLMIDGHVDLLSPLQSEGRSDLVQTGTDRKYPDIWVVNH
jgi:prepilin-type processing-associated H-X9-DG protein